MKDEGGYVHQQTQRGIGRPSLPGRQTVKLRWTSTDRHGLLDRPQQRQAERPIDRWLVHRIRAHRLAIMAWVFRSWRMTLIALVPNVVPLVLVGGIMGLVGIDIKVSTAIIFTIAFGIAVDDTIHMLGKLRIELMKGRSAWPMP
jgi:hypothetical protein